MAMTQEAARQECIRLMREEKKKNLTLFFKNLILTAVIFTVGVVALSLLEQAGIQIRLLRNFILFVIVLAVLIFVEMGIFGILSRYLRAANALRNLEKGFDASVDYVKMLEGPKKVQPKADSRLESESAPTDDKAADSAEKEREA